MKTDYKQGKINLKNDISLGNPNFRLEMLTRNWQLDVLCQEIWQIVLFYFKVKFVANCRLLRILG